MAVSLTPAPLIEQARARRLPLPPEARAIRMAANITQNELAKALGVHTVSVQRWEAGTRRPRGPVAERYAALLAGLAEVASDAS